MDSQAGRALRRAPPAPYGLVDPIEDDEVVFEFVERFGDIEAGTKLSFAVGGERSARAFLPLDPLIAQVVAVDGRGRPALVRHALGRGWGVLCTYPIEHFAARTPGVNPESTWRIYSALAEVAGVSRPIRVADPRVLVGRLRGDEFETVLFVNSSSERISADPILADGVELSVPDGPLLLEPFGVAAVPFESGSPPSATRVVLGAAPAIATGERGDARN